MNEQELGKVAEIEVIKRAIENGFVVSTPHNDRNGYDVILDKDGRLTRIQIKSRSIPDKKRKAVSYNIVIKRGLRNTGSYDKDDFCFLFIYLHKDKVLYIIPKDEYKSSMRLSPYSKVSKYNKFIDAWHLI